VLTYKMAIALRPQFVTSLHPVPMYSRRFTHKRVTRQLQVKCRTGKIASQIPTSYRYATQPPERHARHTRVHHFNGRFPASRWTRVNRLPTLFFFLHLFWTYAILLRAQTTRGSAIAEGPRDAPCHL